MGYWITSLGLVAFGFVGMLSIGRPFFLVGLAMLVLGPVRRRPALFWPPLVAVVAYNVGYWAVAPLYCTATEAVGGPSTTVCSNVLGINYSGSGLYNPSLDPANVAGLWLAGVTFVVVLAAIILKRRSERDVPAP
jgi:hypothetical protein